jgi:alpha-mannosidase
MDKLEPSQTFYSWVMNNHWHTNYRAFQEGPTVFRYAIRPHGGFNAAEATRFATGLTQPLVVTGPAPTKPQSLVKVEGEGVIVTALKPSDDGKAYIVRLFGSSAKPAQATLTWAEPKPGKMWLSDTSEKALQEISGPVSVPAWGIVTVRVERK